MPRARADADAAAEAIGFDGAMHEWSDAGIAVKIYVALIASASSSSRTLQNNSFALAQSRHVRR